MAINMTKTVNTIMIGLLFITTEKFAWQSPTSGLALGGRGNGVIAKIPKVMQTFVILQLTESVATLTLKTFYFQKGDVLQSTESHCRRAMASRDHTFGVRGFGPSKGSHTYAKPNNKLR